MEQVIVKQVSKKYKQGEEATKALDRVSFTIEKGEFVTILGPSGSGKTTLLNLLGGMDQATSGSIELDGEEITNLSDKELNLYRRNKIGFIFQFYNLIPTLTALENVKLSERLNSNAFPAEKTLSALGLSQRKNHFPSELSGGEQQRVSIARAICKNPQLFLCDEPTGALDSETGKQVLQLLKEMSKKEQHTVIMVTHNAAIAKISDRLIRLKDGKVIENTKNPTPLNVEEVIW